MDDDESDENARANKARRGSPFLVSKEVAKLLRIRPQTLAKMRMTGRGPKFRKEGNFVRYHIADVERWLKAHPCDDE
jgi:hypothetical protein